MIQLYFDFIHSNGEKIPLLFRNPINVITTNNVKEIVPCLKKVEAATEQGYYVAGFLSYEAAPAFNPTFQVHNNSQMPLLWFGIFESPVKESLQGDGEFFVRDWVPNTSMEKYYQSFNKIQNYFAQGDTDQVNYTIRLNSEFHGDKITYFKQLASSQSANYSAYLDIGNYSILSASPELFFHVKDGKITTKPMKGTVGRGKTATEDKLQSEWLYHSEKNRKENMLIVELMQSELEKIATPGTVRVPELFTIEKYPTVFQMTSTVTAELKQKQTITNLFQALFPCGSITGTPKAKTIEIINELEDSPREVYCGTIGFMTPEKEAIFNVPIRTVMIDQKTRYALYGAGGGITPDSTKSEEYEEVFTKAKILSNQQPDFQLLESLGLNKGHYIVLDKHMERLQQSAHFFNFTIDMEHTKKLLQNIAKEYHDDFYKVRLLVSKHGELELDIRKAKTITGKVKVSLSTKPVQKSNPFLYYKTTNRQVYEKMREGIPHVFDVLLWNEDKEITEFTLGNIVVEMHGEWYTPPVDCGLLAGTYRAHLLEKSIIRERIITVNELEKCTKLWFINSVREWVPVQLI